MYYLGGIIVFTGFKFEKPRPPCFQELVKATKLCWLYGVLKKCQSNCPLWKLMNCSVRGVNMEKKDAIHFDVANTVKNKWHSKAELSKE